MWPPPKWVGLMEIVVPLRRRTAWFGPALLGVPCALFFALSVKAQNQHPKTPQIMQAPVVVNGKTIFEVPGILSFSAEARAAAITDRIKSLSRDTTFDPKSLSLADSGGTTNILAGDLAIGYDASRRKQPGDAPKSEGN